MIADGVAIGQVRVVPGPRAGLLVRVADVWRERAYDGARCLLIPLPDQVGIYRAVYSTSYVSRWKLEGRLQLRSRDSS